jgi:peptidoglycan/LPS O-acetylase OafA/YrhL
MGQLGRRPGLDGLRAIAVGLVLLHHTALLVPSFADHFTGGFLGVDLFFVLSGCLITTLLLERRERREAHPLRSFYARRALRLLPAVAALLVGNVIVAAVEEGGDVGQALDSFLVVFTYSTNWALLYHFGNLSIDLSHLWSLAIEEQFYLVWPMLLLGALALGLTRRKVGWICLALAIASALWRAELFEGGTSWLAIYIRTDTRADALFIGAAIALFRPDHALARLSPAVRSAIGLTALAAFIGAAVRVHPDSAGLYRGGYTAVALVTGAVIVVELAGPWALRGFLSSPAMVYVGRLSYSLYLWHFLVFSVVSRQMVETAPGVRVAIGWGITFALSALSFRLVERPALRLKDRIGRPRAPTRPDAHEALGPADAYPAVRP